MLGPWPVRDDDVDFLSLLSEVNRRRVLEGSTKEVYPAGKIAFHPEGPPRSFVLERGLARVYAEVPDGRQATVTFVHEHELAGGTAIASHPPRVLIQVVVESTLTILDLEKIRSLAMSENEVCRAVATHLAARVRSTFRLIAIRSLGTIRERVAYDLLDRACRSQLTLGRLEVRATHADLADSIGSSREVVSRTVRDLRAVGIVETTPGMVRVIEPVRLSAIVRGFVI
ncbi:MAG TPA: Crp/Fnr family transcriptional regulator [Candidatus Dormibacteraeota bacterium]